MTDGGTLIMRNGPASPRPRYHCSPSIAPIAIDLEDAFEPARNSDAFGSLRHRTQFDSSRSTTNVSFWSGLVAGLATLGVGLFIAFSAFTQEAGSASGAAALRTPRALEHVASSLRVETAEVSDTRFVPKKKHRARRVVAVADEAAAPEPAPEPEVTETE